MDNYKQAIQAWQEKIGTAKVKTLKEERERYTQNITEYQAELPVAILMPENKSDLTSIVAIANQFHVPIYVVSTGKNWGIGSKIPVVSGCALLILSKMKKIIEVNEKFRYAIIEPGVTQKELSDYLLANTNLMLPVTGSSGDTSVVGNVLERGGVFFNHRYNLLTGLEVLLGSGESLRTGFWHYFDDCEVRKPTFFYPPGVGPDINGLFTQSNLGIVTAMVIRLIPRKFGTIVYAKFKEDNLVALADTFVELKEDNLVHNWMMTLKNNDPRASSENKLNDTHNWSMVFSFSGTGEIEELYKKEVEMRISKFCCELTFLKGTVEHPSVNPYLVENSDSNPYFSILQKMYHGIPSSDSFEKMAQSLNIPFDNSDFDIDFYKKIPGFTTVRPVMPLEGNVIKQVNDLVGRVSEDFQVTPFYEFITLQEMAIQGLFRVSFDRDKEEEKLNAHQWSEKINEELEKIGIYPYRLSITEMNHFITSQQHDSYWKTIAAIKKQLDPNNIISPGKYCLEDI
jgi:4-cresol dehydrogenase (hydroxylating) flavoprotein subunit